MTEAPDNIAPFLRPIAGDRPTASEAALSPKSIELLLLAGAEDKTENVSLRRRLKAAEDARDTGELRLLTLAQALADALDFKRQVEETVASRGFYKGDTP